MGLLERAAQRQKELEKPAEPSKLRTDLDELYEAVRSQGAVPLLEVERRFRVSPAMAESWARLLDKAGLAELHYPVVGQAVLRRRT